VPALSLRRLHAHARGEHAVRTHLCRRSDWQQEPQIADDWLLEDFVEHQVLLPPLPDKKGAIDSYRIFFAASPDMTVDIHDMVAAGGKVAIRATYRGTDKGGFRPTRSAT
jgi:SnoaL-like polyketide cyclase